jgi:hypothetical protein
MQKKIVDFEQICDLYIKEDKSVDIDALLREWFVNTGKEVYEQLMQEEDEKAKQEIEDDQHEIESEEFFSEDELVDDEKEELDSSTDDLENSLDDGETTSLQDLAQDFEKLKAEFDALLAQEEGEEEHQEDDFSSDDLGDSEGSEVEDSETDISDDESQEDDFSGDDLGDEENESEDKEDDVEEAFDFDEFDDLEESFQLETVPNPKISGDKEIGEGGKLSVNTVSPIPQRKGADRAFKGTPVEVRSTQHNGYNQETPPTVKSGTLLKNQVKNAKTNLETVTKDGSKSALLNSKDGFGSENAVSPIGSGAADLRGKGK